MFHCSCRLGERFVFRGMRKVPVLVIWIWMAWSVSLRWGFISNRASLAKETVTLSAMGNTEAGEASSSSAPAELSQTGQDGGQSHWEWLPVCSWKKTSLATCHIITPFHWQACIFCETKKKSQKNENLCFFGKWFFFFFFLRAMVFRIVTVWRQLCHPKSPWRHHF